MFNWFTLSMQQALFGGILIGVAVTLLMVFNAKIAGISGIVGGLFKPVKNDIAWRVCFIAGLILSPWLYQAFRPLPIIEISANTWMLVASGLLVGIGTQLANGCTSGHGVCGIARISSRSIVATLTFIATGMLTVYLMHHFF